MPTPLRIGKEAIPLNQALKHSTILMANKVHTLHLSRRNLLTKTSLSVAVTPAIVAITIVKHKIVDSQGPAIRLQTIKGLLQLEEGADTFKTFSGPQAVATTAVAEVTVIKEPLRTIHTHPHHHNQLPQPKQPMTTIHSGPRKISGSRIKQRRTQKCHLLFGKAPNRPSMKALNSALHSNRSLQPQLPQNRHRIWHKE